MQDFLVRENDWYIGRGFGVVCSKVYPREPLPGAVREAARYGLYDLDRLERMILRRVTRELFLLDGESDDD